MNWINVRTLKPRIWKWVYVRCHFHEEHYYIAYRTFSGKWKFKSGFKAKIQQQNFWCNINAYNKRTR